MASLINGKPNLTVGQTGASETHINRKLPRLIYMCVSFSRHGAKMPRYARSTRGPTFCIRANALESVRRAKAEGGLWQ
jgi:hypothetical protein